MRLPDPLSPGPVTDKSPIRLVSRISDETLQNCRNSRNRGIYWARISAFEEVNN